MGLRWQGNFTQKAAPPAAVMAKLEGILGLRMIVMHRASII
jgi:hypothetical protein